METQEIAAKAPSTFERLAAINVGEWLEKKGQLSYLSWAWAVDRLLREDASATWSYADIQYLPNRTAIIWCSVTAFGKTMTEPLPVMDHRNKPICEPDAFQINTAMKRCLVKAIALHGIGLYVYAGEDLPPGEKKDEDEAADNKGASAANDDQVLDPNRPNTATQVAKDAFDVLSIADQKYLHDMATTVIDMVEGDDDAHGYIEAQKLSTELRLGLWSLLPSHVRTALQKAARPNAPGPRTKGKTPAQVAPELASQP